MKPVQFALILICAVAASYATARFSAPPPQQPIVKKEDDVFDRVMRARTIKCGYVVTHPFLFKDANTGALSGIAHDAIEKMAENLSLKIEWAEEAGWSTMLEGLSTQRYDMLCSAIWSTTSRSLKADFLKPLSYAGVHAWARPGDARFEKGLSEIDWSTVKIATIDGHISDIIARAKFPAAQKLSLPDTSSIPEVFMAVAAGKADITFEQNYIGLEFLSKNPGAVASVTKDHPIKVFPTTFLIPQGAEKFKAMLNAAQDELTNSGYIGGLIDKYETYPGSFYRPVKPYEMQK
ncbi:MAG: transporter substrate-binding domain-containing protein [Alphaproteobacteria bacterium]